ncbi:NADP-dependent oxidoreductase [Rufibacter hautae]|uniref:NADP-dependent oxidoreductase n=1 Tax=Rufibacter hautae TaxID=2595005 RepID=A0A5B6TLF3_9BACT|nr:NADP-dependent oxidoreductase [Rufibacter hautae]KAA3436922.1 NADP-dependent oxidoreductase [Rufibacter hautae]
MARQMKAAFYEAFGGPDKIKIGELEIPQVQEGEVLVRVKAAAVNPVDNAVMAGWLSSKLPVHFPAIPGWDVAGVVEDRGFSARRFNVGDEVYAYARRPVVQHGTFAEYIVIPESYLAHRPKNLSFEESAGIPLVGLTAYQVMFDAGQLQAGQTVLILGASGGIGNLGIQLAKWKGATVIGVASQKNHAFMQELGADHTVDYNGTHVGEAVKQIVPEGVDLIFDAASGETLQQSLIALKPGGKLISILNTGEDLDKSIDFQYVFVEPNSTQLEHLRELAEGGHLKVRVSERYSLDQAAEALQQIASHHTTGKIVVVP